MTQQALTGRPFAADDDEARGLARLTRGVPLMLFGGVFAIVAWIAAAPFIMLVYSSLTADRDKLPFETTRLSFENYISLLTDARNLNLLWTTAAFTIGATVIGVGLAIFFAWLIERTDVFGRRFLFVAILTPMAIPSMIYAMAWIQLCGPNNGLVNATLVNLGLGFLQVNVFSLTSMIVIQGLALASHAYLLIAIAFRNFDSSFEEQAFMCGRGRFSTVFAITLPMLKPALLAAGLFFTVVSMETFDIPITLGLTSHVQVVSTQIYWSTHPESGRLPDYGVASALSVGLVIIAYAMISLYNRATRDAKRFVSITARGFRPRPIPLGPWRWPLFGIAFLFVIVAVALPLFILIWRSLLRFYQYPSMTAVKLLNVNAYFNIFNDPDIPKVLGNTLKLSVGASAAVSVLAAAIAWQVVRGPAASAWRRRLNMLAFFPQSIPGVVVGLALIFIYLWLPIPIYGTLWIMGLAMVTRFLAYSVGSIIAAQMQISSELEEAARVAGASRAWTYLRVVLPLVTPAIIATFLWVSIHVVRELGLSLMLYTLQSQVLSTKIWLLWENGRVADACATGVLTVVGLLLLLGTPALVRGLRGAVRVATGRAG
jgi:iron(III) transport system permease protein